MKHHIIVMILGLSALKTSAADGNWCFGAGGGIAEVHGGYAQVFPANFPAITQSDLGVSLVGFYPVSSHFRLFGGAGLGWSWERVRTTDEILSASPNPFVEPDTTRQFLRVQLRAGTELSVTRLLSLRVDWDRPDANLRNWRGYNSVQELSIDNFSATALWAF